MTEGRSHIGHGVWVGSYCPPGGPHLHGSACDFSAARKPPSLPRFSVHLFFFFFKETHFTNGLLHITVLFTVLTPCFIIGPYNTPCSEFLINSGKLPQQFK